MSSLRVPIHGRNGGIALAAGYALVLAALLLWLSSSSGEEMRETLRSASPRALEAAFVLLIAGAGLSLSAIRETLPGGTFFPPVAIALLALVAVRSIPPETHRIYYDEDIYQNVAQNIVWAGRAQMCNEGTIEAGTFQCDASEYNKEPNAFPYLLSLAFRLAGVREDAAHAVNHLLFALGAVSVYWLASMLFQGAAAGLGAALVYVLTPQNLLWGATVAAEPGAASFAALALGAFVLFCRRPDWATGVFAAASLAFASQFRPESGLVLIAAGGFVLLVHRGRLGHRGLWAAALLVLALIVPLLAHLWAVRHEPWGAVETAKFSLAYVRENAATNFAYYVSGQDFPRLFTALALAGLLLRGARREWLSVFLWFALAFGIFIPFYAGSYRYGADVRFSLVSSAPLAVLAGAGLAWMAQAARKLPRTGAYAAAAPYLLALFAASAYLPFSRAVGRESWASRADHAAALRMIEHVPEDGIVLTHNPGMIQVMGRSAAQTSLATHQPERIDDYFRRLQGGVYFHYNFWCNVPDPVQNEFCHHVLKTYETRVVMEESVGFYRYVLYRLLPRSAPPPSVESGR